MKIIATFLFLLITQIGYTQLESHGFKVDSWKVVEKSLVLKIEFHRESQRQVEDCKILVTKDNLEKNPTITLQLPESAIQDDVVVVKFICERDKDENRTEVLLDNCIDGICSAIITNGLNVDPINGKTFDFYGKMSKCQAMFLVFKDDYGIKQFIRVPLENFDREYQTLN